MLNDDEIKAISENLLAAIDDNNALKTILEKLTKDDKIQLLERFSQYKNKKGKLAKIIYSDFLTKEDQIQALGNNDILIWAAGQDNSELIDAILKTLTEDEKKHFYSKKPSTFYAGMMNAFDAALSHIGTSGLRSLYSPLSFDEKLKKISNNPKVSTLINYGDIEKLKVFLEDLNTVEKSTVITTIISQYSEALLKKLDIFKLFISALSKEQIIELILPSDPLKKSLLTYVKNYTLIEVIDILLSYLDDDQKKSAYALMPKQFLLRRAIINDQFSEFKTLCNGSGIDFNEIVLGDTLLTLALRHRRNDALELLCEQPNIDLNLRDKNYKLTPLYLAVEFKNPKAVEILSQQAKQGRIDLLATDEKGFTALDRANHLPDRKAEADILRQTMNISMQSDTSAEVIAKADFITRLTHELGASHLEMKLTKNAVAVETKGEGNYVSKSAIAIEEDLRKIYSRDASNPHIEKILDAFQTNKTYYANECSELNPDILLDRFNSDKMVMLTSGWRGHAIGLVLYKNKLVISNRGQGMHPMGGVLIYDIDPTKVTKEYLRSISYDSNGTQSEMMKRIQSIILPDPEFSPVKAFDLKAQKHGTCSFVNPKGTIQAMLYLLKNEELVESENQAEIYARTEYKKITKQIRDNAMTDFIDKIKNNDQSLEDKFFYFELAVKLLEGTQLANFDNNTKIMRLFRLITALQSEFHHVKTNVEIEKSYREVLLSYASYPQNINNPVALHALIDVTADLPKQAFNDFFDKSKLHVKIALVNSLRLGLQNPNAPESKKYFDFAKRLIENGVGWDLQPDLEMALNKKNYVQANSIIEVMIPVSNSQSFQQALDSENWHEASQQLQLENFSVNKRFSVSASNSGFLLFSLEKLLKESTPKSIAELLIKHAKDEDFEYALKEENRQRILEKMALTDPETAQLLLKSFAKPPSSYWASRVIPNQSLLAIIKHHQDNVNFKENISTMLDRDTAIELLNEVNSQNFIAYPVAKLIVDYCKVNGFFRYLLTKLLNEIKNLAKLDAAAAKILFETLIASDITKQEFDFSTQDIVDIIHHYKDANIQKDLKQVFITKGRLDIVEGMQSLQEQTMDAAEVPKASERMDQSIMTLTGADQKASLFADNQAESNRSVQAKSPVISPGNKSKGA